MSVGRLLLVKFVNPILIKRFRHAGAGLDQHDFFLAASGGREKKRSTEKNREELAGSCAHSSSPSCESSCQIFAGTKQTIVTRIP